MMKVLSTSLLLCCGFAAVASETKRLRGEGKTREQRFPSVAERVKLYMSNWYVPSCPEYKDGLVRYEFTDGEWPTLMVQPMKKHPLVNHSAVLAVESKVTPDKLLYMHEETIENCADPLFNGDEETDKRQLELAERVQFRLNMKMYCADVHDSLVTANNHVEWEGSSKKAPILLQFGDNKVSHVYGTVMIPHIKKFRSSATSPEELERVTSKKCYDSPRDALVTAHANQTLQPIVWKLASSRHYGKLYQVYKEDSPWGKKKDMAVFRGQLTGSRYGYNSTLSDEENCMRMKRCRLVYNHANSSLIYARLTNTRDKVPNVLNGVELVGGKVDLEILLQHKGIIMIEGNDVASGLKWALLSQSVVLMPPPKHTSWAMEELLEPWVHYVPLNDLATDVEERMQWVVDNDAEAQRISARATLWMEDLVFHPDAAEDDRLIEEEMLRRYRLHFRSA
mmetsp:Transcript_39666/g.60983  ORF Transcript_39666/g.60983 Transcript_39666/m.60983 type:complete len:451 (+) Transcript_39666:161-1513(+)